MPGVRRALVPTKFTSGTLDAGFVVEFKRTKTQNFKTPWSARDAWQAAEAEGLAPLGHNPGPASPASPPHQQKGQEVPHSRCEAGGDTMNPT